MRRKTFDVLFETRDGMRLLVQERCMWRSLWYFALSVGLFSGVVTNQLFLDQALSVRFAVIGGRCFHCRRSFVDVWFFAARDFGNFRSHGR